MLEVLIPFVLVVVGGVILYGGYRLWLGWTARPVEPHVELPTHGPDALVRDRGVGPDEFVYLFGHLFCLRAKQRPPLDGRYDKTIAPLTEEELDGQHLAIQMLYVSLAELHREGFVELRMFPRDPTFMPPFPQKTWEMRLRRYGPLPPSPICDCLQAAIDLIERKRLSRARNRAGLDADAQVELTEDDLFLPLDDIIERALRVMRQELTFWEKKGVYGDLSCYVASALVARGFLEDVTGETWLDRVRARRLAANRERIEPLREEAERLAARLADFRQRYGSDEAQQPDDPAAPAHGAVAAAIKGSVDDPSELPLDDCLRLSIYETLVCMRQLEPSGGI